jgi:excinuclease ABC A subunit
MMREGAGAVARERRRIGETWQVRGARANNLRNVDVDIPKGVLVAVTGVAGSGKSSLVHNEFVAQNPGAIVVDQSAIGRSSRSNPATYLGLFDDIRKTFARETGKPAALFSFNSKGACPTCKGQGRIAVEMNFLDDVKVECSECRGRRYTNEVLALTWRDLSIHDVLSLTAREALDVFDQESIHRQLALLCEVGLDYLTLGQPLSTLSGGECQRIKLVMELGKSGNLYVLDEPTTGLHFADIERLMAILDRLVDDGNSVVVIEHNLDVVTQADWVIDLGPEGGDAGGRLVAAGTPEQIAEAPGSHTGRFLAERLRAT